MCRSFKKKPTETHHPICLELFGMEKSGENAGRSRGMTGCWKGIQVWQAIIKICHVLLIWKIYLPLPLKTFGTFGGCRSLGSLPEFQDESHPSFGWRLFTWQIGWEVCKKSPTGPFLNGPISTWVSNGSIATCPISFFDGKFSLAGLHHISKKNTKRTNIKSTQRKNN